MERLVIPSYRIAALLDEEIARLQAEAPGERIATVATFVALTRYLDEREELARRRMALAGAFACCRCQVGVSAEAVNRFLDDAGLRVRAEEEANAAK